MNTTDTNQIQLLTATVQQLVSKIERMEAMQLPKHNWLSSKELSLVIGVTDRTIQNWRKEGKFPKETYCRKRRGKYDIYKFDKVLAVEVAERLKRGDYPK